MENEILQLLKSSPKTSFSVKEVGKRVDRKQFREQPNWARPLLERLVTQQQAVKTTDGKYQAQSEIAQAR